MFVMNFGILASPAEATSGIGILMISGSVRLGQAQRRKPRAMEQLARYWAGSGHRGQQDRYETGADCSWIAEAS
jgi:hypothetical protein